MVADFGLFWGVSMTFSGAGLGLFGTGHSVFSGGIGGGRRGGVILGVFWGVSRCGKCGFDVGRMAFWAFFRP